MVPAHKSMASLRLTSLRKAILSQRSREHFALLRHANTRVLMKLRDCYSD